MNVNRMRGYAVVLLAASMLLLSACGFQLRGEVTLAPQLSRVYIDGASQFDPLMRELTQSLKSAGSSVVSSIEDATAVLQVLTNRGDRRVLSVQATGKAQEYELYQIFEFKVRDTAGRELLSPQRLEMTRDYLFDPNDVLGKAGEEETLRRDMRRDLARLAMLRLGAVAK